MFALNRGAITRLQPDSRHSRARNIISNSMSNVSQVSRSRQGKKLRAKDRPLANDFVSDEEFDRLLDAWFGNIARVLLPGPGAVTAGGGYANVANYPPVLKRHGLYFSQALIWDKQHPVLTRKDFMGAHEWCFYCWKGRRSPSRLTVRIM